MIYRPTRVHKEDPEYYTTSFPPMKYAIDRLRDVSGCTPHLHNPELTFRNGTAGNRTRCVPLASAKTILFKHFISLFIPLLRSILPPEVYTSGWYIPPGGIYIYIYIWGRDADDVHPPQNKHIPKPVVARTLRWFAGVTRIVKPDARSTLPTASLTPASVTTPPPNHLMFR